MGEVVFVSTQIKCSAQNQAPAWFCATKSRMNAMRNACHVAGCVGADFSLHRNLLLIMAFWF
jgi:hypothetical protein